jgi:hypothetical protein
MIEFNQSSLKIFLKINYTKISILKDLSRKINQIKRISLTLKSNFHIKFFNEYIIISDFYFYEYLINFIQNALRR